MDGAEEIAGRFVVACGDGAVLLEAGKEVLDQVPSLVEIAIVTTLDTAYRVGRNHDLLAGMPQGLNQPWPRVVGTIGDDGLGSGVGKQCIGALQIMCLTCGEMESGGVAQCIDRGVDLGTQPASAASDRLRRPPFAPALC